MPDASPSLRETQIFRQPLKPVSQNIQHIQEISGSVNLVRPANTEAFLASKTRRELYTRLRNAYGKFERNEPLNPEDESKTLKILTNFFEEDPYNERVILYLPDKILPDYNSPDFCKI